MSEKKVTIKDVARVAGVSISTVSRFLNNNFSSMSETTKQRIENIIESLNYHPNKLAQGLKGQSRTIAIVVVNMSYPFCVSVIRAISEVLNDSGYSLLVCESGGDDQKEATLIRSLVAQGVDAIILQTNGGNNDLLEQHAKTMPIILVDRQYCFPGSYNVVTDNKEASRQLTEALFAQGYEQVCFVSEPLEGLSTRLERYNGYLQACADQVREPRIYWAHRDEPEDIRSAVAEIAQMTKAPFAVYTANALLMLGLYPLLTELPFQVPKQMGLATFDEPNWVKITNPRLTCVRQPTSEIGRLAADTVLGMLRNEISPEALPSVQVIPSQLVLSTATQLKSHSQSVFPPQ